MSHSSKLDYSSAYTGGANYFSLKSWTFGLFLFTAYIYSIVHKVTLNTQSYGEPHLREFLHPNLPSCSCQTLAPTKHHLNKYVVESCCESQLVDWFLLNQGKKE